MVMITNIQHFLNKEGQIPDMPAEAQALLRFLSTIVEAASTAYDQPITFADVPCRNVVDGTACPGEIEAWVYFENNQIGWGCLECGDSGIISHWEGTLWDKRDYTRH